MSLHRRILLGLVNSTLRFVVCVCCGLCFMLFLVWLFAGIIIIRPHLLCQCQQFDCFENEHSMMCCCWLQDLGSSRKRTNSYSDADSDVMDLCSDEDCGDDSDSDVLNPHNCVDSSNDSSDNSCNNSSDDSDDPATYFDDGSDSAHGLLASVRSLCLCFVLLVICRLCSCPIDLICLFRNCSHKLLLVVVLMGCFRLSAMMMMMLKSLTDVLQMHTDRLAYTAQQTTER